MITYLNGYGQRKGYPMDDFEIRDFARSFTKGVLNGEGSDMMCWMVCAPLQACFSSIGISCELVEGKVSRSHHFWIEFPDGRIIDPTAKQFGLKNIWLKPRPQNYVR